MNRYMKQIGLDNILKYDLISKRKVFHVDDINIDIIVKSLNLGDHYESHYKVNNKGFQMNWHIDGFQTYKKGVNDYNMIQKFELFKWTLMIYTNNYGIDFKGGIFEFADGHRIYPKKGVCLLFDSRDVHMVHLLTKGTRNNYLVKIY
jgi:hypothetical protein